MENTTVSVRVGRLLAGAEEIGEGSTRPLRGVAVTPEGEVAVVAKRLSNREIAVEVICAALGRSAGIPIPEPLLLLGPDNSWYFGSADSGHPNLSKFVSHHDAAVLDELERWPDLLAAACFDELIANPDRHDGNILYNGLGFLLIDHGLCLPFGMPPIEQSDDYHTNRLLDLARSACRDELSAQRTVNRSRAWAENKSAGAVENADAYASESINPETRDQLISFLKARVTVLGDLLHEKLKPSGQWSFNFHG